MNSEILIRKARDLQIQMEPCLQFYRERSIALNKKQEIISSDRLFLEEIMRVMSYLNCKQKLSTLTLQYASDLFNEIYPEIFWNVESLQKNIDEYTKKRGSVCTEFDSDIFDLPKILEIAKDYDDVHNTTIFDTASLFLVQIFHLLVKSDGTISSIEEKFLLKYDTVINRKKFAPLMDDKQFANQLSRIYDDFFGFTESLKKQSSKIDMGNNQTQIANNNKQENKSQDQQKSQPEAQEEKKESLEELLSELNGLIGLSAVKAEVENIINVLKVEKIRSEKGMKVPDKSLHLVFTGNPGTGKTTIARILARIYKSLGVLQKGHLIETDRSGLVAGFVGQTANKTLEICKSALDGVLFIDEAYALAEGGDNDFGREAINTLLKFMEDNRARIIVIVAGYTHKMEEFIDKNPGLKSRFNKYIEFSDYTPEELMQIFEKICKGMKLSLSDSAKEKINKLFQEAYEKRDDKFGNGRFARNLFEKAYMQQANRLVKLEKITDEDLTILHEEDIQPI
jgi:SpoVK/Ycf46/Vps4 family AAA+-type ATPase